MKSILVNTDRIAHFTSSEAWRLMTNNKDGEAFGAQGLSYIEEKNIEIRLGRALKIEKSSKTTAWAKFLEQRVHDLLPRDYKLLSDLTICHPKYEKFWSGSQDNVCEPESVVGDTKCFEPQNFAQYNDVLKDATKTGSFKEWKKEFPKEYWQLISNSCIWGFKFIEAIVYMPYESELEEIRNMAMNYKGEDPWRYRFIYESDKCEIPYLPDGNPHYKNLNIYRFEAPKEDKAELERRVILAEKKLVRHVEVLEERKEKARNRMKEGEALRSKLHRKHDAI